MFEKNDKNDIYLSKENKQKKGQSMLNNLKKIQKKMKNKSGS